MAANKPNPHAGEMDYPAHEKNYAGFVSLLKTSTIVTAIITLIVVLIIAY